MTDTRLEAMRPSAELIIVQCWIAEGIITMAEADKGKATLAQLSTRQVMLEMLESVAQVEIKGLAWPQCYPVDMRRNWN